MKPKRVEQEDLNPFPDASLDDIDWKILRILQDNARLATMEIAEAVGLSHSACSRRVRRLEETGVIRGYRAQLDRDKTGFSVRAFVVVYRQPEVPWRRVADAIIDIEGVCGCYVTSGEADLFVEIVTTSMKKFSEIILERLQGAIGVTGTRSYFVFEELKSTW